MSLRTHRT